MSFQSIFIDLAKKTLEKEGLIIEQSEVANSGQIDLIAKDVTSGEYYVFEVKSSPISTFEVSRFKSALKDIELKNVSGYIVTNSVPSGSACELSRESDIGIIKVDNKNDISTVVVDIVKGKASAYVCDK